MNKLHLATLIAAGLYACPAFVNAGPSMSIGQAAVVAQEHLKERGLTNRIFVTSLALEKEAITRGERYWYARWSESVGLEERKTELGLRINMDGSLVRVVESPEVRNPGGHRTRSTRPSILDLKH